MRRTVYARVSRGRLSNLLKVYDFPDPVQTSARPRPDHDVAAAAFRHEQPVHARRSRGAGGIGEAGTGRQGEGAQPVSQVLSRDPSAKELDLALGYLAQGTLEQYAQVLLSSNEEIFWQ